LASLLDRLQDIDHVLAAYAVVLHDYASGILTSAGKNDFNHCMAVLGRLTQLCGARNTLVPGELFVLVSSSFLHDIERPIAAKRLEHGPLAAHMIRRGHLPFPCVGLKEAVAVVCSVHDESEAKELSCLQPEMRLDIRPGHVWQPPPEERRIRVRALAAVFRLADVLDMTADRFPRHDGSGIDPREVVVGVHVSADTGSIYIEPHGQSGQCVADTLTEYVGRELEWLKAPLAEIGMSFELVDSLPQTGPLTTPDQEAEIKGDAEPDSRNENGRDEIGDETSAASGEATFRGLCNRVLRARNQVTRHILDLARPSRNGGQKI